MTTERLWAPWRLSYIVNKDSGIASEPGERPDAPPPLPPGACFLCHYLAAEQRFDREHYVLHRGPTTVTVLNRYPYNNGHLLVAPLEHKGGLGDLTPAELLECQTELVTWTEILSRTFKAQGFNIGLNLGSVAGAGLPGHLHWHIVPRWAGDTNYMPVVAATHVLPQALETAWEILASARSASE